VRDGENSDFNEMKKIINKKGGGYPAPESTQGSREKKMKDFGYVEDLSVSLSLSGKSDRNPLRKSGGRLGELTRLESSDTQKMREKYMGEKGKERRQSFGRSSNTFFHRV